MPLDFRNSLSEPVMVRLKLITGDCYKTVVPVIVGPPGKVINYEVNNVFRWRISRVFQMDNSHEDSQYRPIRTPITQPKEGGLKRSLAALV